MGLDLRINGYTGQLEDIATPVYYYDLALLDDTIDRCLAAAASRGYKVHYALKANFNPRVLERICARGLGADCVSGNEVATALETGFKPGDIVFAGVGKSDVEMVGALKAGIFCFNCESLQELQVLNGLAAASGVVASVALRMNPNVNAYTHQYITTGLADNKFGINLSDFSELVQILRTSRHLRFLGVHVHVGSQVTDLEVFKNLCVRVNSIRDKFVAADLAVTLLNLGGGLGIDYSQPDVTPVPDFKAYFDVFERYLDVRPGEEVHFELGRALVAQCGNLLSKVLFVKKGTTNFIILDAGMTELIRPALYQAYHQIENMSRAGQPLNVVYDIAGPICETSDTFQQAVSFPETFRGDLIAIRSAGAYGEVMASRYNLRDHAGSLYAG